jgi:hypothetical protein
MVLKIEVKNLVLLSLQDGAYRQLWLVLQVGSVPGPGIQRRLAPNPLQRRLAPHPLQRGVAAEALLAASQRNLKSNRVGNQIKQPWSLGLTSAGTFGISFVSVFTT